MKMLAYICLLLMISGCSANRITDENGYVVTAKGVDKAESYENALIQARTMCDGKTVVITDKQTRRAVKGLRYKDSQPYPWSIIRDRDDKYKTIMRFYCE